MTTPPPVIVYIDDEPLLCSVFQRILEGSGASVVTFTDPEHALAYVGSHPIAVVVCDYRMPMISGLDVLARVEASVPFILISGDIAIASLVARNPRVTHFLYKPFQPETLLALLGPYLPPSTAGG
ncbi:MAG: Fis family transcriptional regulator [Deltaproteobacteria bacterium]|nr:Fis family transcriptional regulator [Deltaproteobacteria bacterium]